MRSSRDEPNDDPPLSERIFDFSGYCKGAHLATGGTGDVFLYQKGSDMVAVKTIRAYNDMDQKVFLREIESMAKLDHLFIVPLEGYNIPSPENGNNYVIVTPYYSGGSLLDAINEQPEWFDNTAKVIMIWGIAQAMKYAHSMGVIHRDLKPANVLVSVTEWKAHISDDDKDPLGDPPYIPCICDFGSSRFVLDARSLTSSPTLTPFYAAPELYGKEYTNKVDVYSFGVMLYEIITGKLAFREFNMLQLALHIASGNRETIPDTVTPFAKCLIEKCWNPDPDCRPSFDEICELLSKEAYLLAHPHDQIGRNSSKYHVHGGGTHLQLVAK